MSAGITRKGDRTERTMPLIESVPPRASTVPSAAANTDWPYLYEPTPSLCPAPAQALLRWAALPLGRAPA